MNFLTARIVGAKLVNPRLRRGGSISPTVTILLRHNTRTKGTAERAAKQEVLGRLHEDGADVWLRYDELIFDDQYSMLACGRTLTDPGVRVEGHTTQEADTSPRRSEQPTTSTAGSIVAEDFPQPPAPSF